MIKSEPLNFTELAANIKALAKDLGFQQVGITDTELTHAKEHLETWIKKGWHGTMSYMSRNIEKRENPVKLVPGTLRIISVRMDYLPENPGIQKILRNPTKAYISRYALGRDYHKLIRKRLNKLAAKISDHVDNFGYRAFTDSAPVLEKAIAEKTGFCWIGKHTLTLSREAGSWFFLGELYTDLPLPIDQSKDSNNHCGSCTACIDICPTQAIRAPYQLDARRCISYLTIENKGPIPLKLRPLLGNRIFGCDDCQLICPWNRFAKPTQEKDFQPRHYLNDVQLTELFAWSEQEYLKKTEGSALRRVGYEGWLRNIAVALGNAPHSPEIIQALQSRRQHESPLVREHVEWALQQFPC